ncbi:predicted protein [Pyrenophora tritici-repentis Pt-1C-BFP]|uniref:Uncharacterized protein n=1 Tax=Pyrenophora tritici-repentis (strain Pt-1C-BFP) TaxID=426418 RepID=B2W5Q0_PYRTR|nr:uncharacterized protein PTRG_06058 [Pyrenophora tritici-repentis Pt-1C-BFP]EDU48978.1 predicted protein [Pyrenophora tritici-repentis Pt-1C-BFP]
MHIHTTHTHQSTKSKPQLLMYISKLTQFSIKLSRTEKCLNGGYPTNGSCF